MQREEQSYVDNNKNQNTDKVDEFKKAMIEVESSWKNTMDLLVNA